MKGKVSFYYNAVNTGKVRTRVENPGKEFTQNIRAAISEVTVEVLNSSLQEIRSKLIVKFQKMGLTLKDARYAAQLTNPLQPYFDVVYSATPFSGEDEDEGDTPDETPAEEAKVEAPAAEDFDD